MSTERRPEMTVPRVIIDRDVAATMRDGTVLRADIVRPDTTIPCPVLLCRTPYGKQSALISPFLDAVSAAAAGYLVVLQDVRGRGRSQGEWQPFVNEFDDGADTVAWAAEIAGSDGHVGMFGASYLGFTQWAAATRQPAALRAIVPALTWSDARNGLIERGGTPETGLTCYLQHFGFAPGAPDPDIIDSLAEDATYAPERVSSLASSDAATCSIPLDSHDPATTIPALNIAGWYDTFLAGTIDHYQRSRTAAESSAGAASRLIVGPWSHINFTSVSGTHSFGERAAFTHLAGADMSRLIVDWFDHWLRDRPYTHPWLTGSSVTAFDMGTNRWAAHDSWPPSPSRMTTWAIDAAGVLRPASDVATRHGPHTVIGERVPSWPGGAVHMHPSRPAGVIDQRTRLRRDGELQFTSPTLVDDVVFAGPVAVQFCATGADQSIDVVARLSVIHGDGFERNITDGVQRVEPGDGGEHIVDLWSTYITIKRGQCLRLTISATGWPRWGVPRVDPPTVTIDHVTLEVTEFANHEHRPSGRSVTWGRSTNA